MKITHKSGDCGYFITGNTHDVFAVTHDDGTPIAEVRFDYEGDDTNFQSTLVQSIQSVVAMLDSCAGDMHFLASLQYAIIKGFGDDEDFYFEQFYDEDGNEKPRQFTLLPL